MLAWPPRNEEKQYENDKAPLDVEAISEVPRDSQDKPLKDIIVKIRIEETVATPPAE